MIGIIRHPVVVSSTVVSSRYYCSSGSVNDEVSQQLCRDIESIYRYFNRSGWSLPEGYLNLILEKLKCGMYTLGPLSYSSTKDPSEILAILAVYPDIMVWKTEDR